MKKSILASSHPLLAAAAAVGLVATGTAALADLSYTEARKLQETGQVLAEPRVVELVGKTRPGEITALELEREAGRLVYDVEVRDAQFQKWELMLDAVTGEVLKEKIDD